MPLAFHTSQDIHPPLKQYLLRQALPGSPSAVLLKDNLFDFYLHSSLLFLQVRYE